jgi:Arm DNA-binding domain/Phage integrase central domain
MGLTTKRIAKLRRRPRGRFHDGHGLYLQVRGPRSASWIQRYIRHAEERMLGLGPLQLVGLAEARQRARAARLQLLDGIDPVEHRKQKKLERVLAAAKTMTFEQAAKAYHAQHEAKWKNAKHAQQFINTLRDYAFPIIGQLPVASIDTGLVLKVLEPHRERTRLGHGARLSQRRQSRPLERTPCRSPSGAGADRQGRSPRRPALRRRAELHGCATNPPRLGCPRS